MNDQDVQTIRNRLLGGRHQLGNLRIFSLVHQAGKVVIAEEDMPLTQAQKDGIKDAFNALAVKIESQAPALDDPTGMTGIINQDTLAQIQEAPIRLVSYINQCVEEVDTLLRLPPAELPDGSWGLIFPDAVAQQLADKLATLAAAVQFVVGMERLKVK